MDVPDDGREELRLAVVLNGGVSLAVWIAGVVHQIDQLVKAQQQSAENRNVVFRGLGQLVNADVRVDVITGTSAGGVNAPALALAQLFPTDLSRLGQLWIDKGGFVQLLRSPLKGDAPSLMDGDGYFLDSIQSAFASLAEGTRDENRPVELVITGSLMRGGQVIYADDFGNNVVETECQARFCFRSPSGPVEAGSPPAGGFDDVGLVKKLALAARSTAANPWAFEASWVPVGGSDSDTEHPDMAGIVQLRGGANVKGSRWVLDGGVLLNKPVEPALDAIDVLPAHRQVRRLLVYVQPDPGEQTPSSRPDLRAAAPGFGKVLAASAFELPKNQSIAADLERVRLHNAAARRARAARADRLNALDGLPPEEVASLAGSFLPAYRSVRARAAIERIVRELGLFGLARWTPAQLETALADAVKSSPFLPTETADQWPTPASGSHADLVQRAGSWGIEAADRFAALVLDISRRAMWLDNRQGSTSGASIDPTVTSTIRQDIETLRAAVHEGRRKLRVVRAMDASYWQSLAFRLPPEFTWQALGAWANEAINQWPVRDPDHDDPTAVASAAQDRVAQRTNIGQVMVDLAGSLVSARASLILAAAVPGLVPDAAEEIRTLAILAGAALGTSQEPTAADVLQRALDFEVIHVLFDDPDSDQGLEIALMHLTAYTENRLGQASSLNSPKKQLTGIGLSHFAGFYKSSWRANDWVWGRIDATTHMVQAMLDPGRLVQLGYEPVSLIARLQEIATGVQPDSPSPDLTDAFDSADDKRYLLEDWNTDLPAIEAELAFLSSSETQPPPFLTDTVYAVARRVHLKILREELPRLVAAVLTDENAGGATETEGHALATGFHPDLAAHDLVDLWARHPISGESLGSEMPSDLMAKTVSKTFGVASSVVAGTRSGLGFLRRLTSGVRAVGLVIWMLANSATSGGRFGANVVDFALAVGGAALAISLLVPGAPAILVLFGVAVLLTGLFVAALRTRGAWRSVLVLVLLLLVVIVVIAAGAYYSWFHTNTQALITVGLAAVMAMLFLAIDVVRRPRKKAPPGLPV